LVGGDPFGQGRSKVKSVVRRLIKVEGYGVGGRDAACRRLQLDRSRLDCRQGRARDIASEHAAPRLRP